MPIPEIIESDVTISPEKLNSVEMKFNIRFPDQYRQWILKYNGGRPWPNSFHYKDETGPYTDGCISWFLAIEPGTPSLENNYWNMKLHPNGPRFPEDLVAIADEMSGNLICISVKGPNVGKIYFWDHEEETFPASYANCHLIADSFNEFINGLYEV